ncbi:MAG: hypothetical protein WBA74_15400 [Cyclobacteriaceae bacterium]
MAEIKIEKKKPVWPWILLALLIVAAVAYFVLDDDDAENRVTDIEDTEQVEKVSADISDRKTMAYESSNEFSQYVANEDGKMGLDHVYTHKAFEKLIDAIKEVADNNDYDITVDLQKATDLSDQIKKDPMSLKHANMIKSGFMITSKALENIKNAKYSDAEMSIDELKTIASQLNVDEPTLDQKTVVKSYFDTSAEVIKEMNNRTKS